METRTAEAAGNVPWVGRSPDRETIPAFEVAGRLLHPTVVFDTYWEFAAERQAVYEARIAGDSAPWSNDPILSRHKFTNCYRAADRVSQYLITEVAYKGSQEAREVVFRIILFKMFNKISTWDLLLENFGTPSWSDFNVEAYDAVLSKAFDRNQTLYSAAYVIPPPRFGSKRKHTNHLRLLEHMMRTDLPSLLDRAPSMFDAFKILESYPAMGKFLAYQFLIDINYSTATDFDEMEFVVPGPGARDGIRKCFGPTSHGIEADIIQYMAEHQHDHFARLDLDFNGLLGRPLQLIDCQNLFCEVDKYARVAHPDIPGISGRSRIKQLFKVNLIPLTQNFPSKWGLA